MHSDISQEASILFQERMGCSKAMGEKKGKVQKKMVGREEKGKEWKGINKKRTEAQFMSKALIYLKKEQSG